MTATHAPGSAEARAALRAGVSSDYHWSRHVGLIAAFTAAGLWLAAAQLDDFGAADVLGIAAILVVINLGEYAAHRWHLHVPRFPRAVYHRHVVEHHRFFTAVHMAVDTADDVRWVLFPPWALPLLVVTILPYVLVLRVLVSADAGWLFVLTVIGYYGVYEVLHAAAHLPSSSALARVGAVQRLARHHRIHHDPALMRRWNFNFAVPLGDRLFGTEYSGAHESDSTAG